MRKTLKVNAKYNDGKLPEVITTFGTVFFIMSFLYWGIVLADIISKMGLFG